MTRRFLKFMEIVKNFENGPTGNGYVNDPVDAGGETVSGVTRKNYPSLKIWTSLDKISDVAKKKSYQPTKEEWDEIYKIYFDLYYQKVNAEDIMDEQLAIQVFDFAVNGGVSRSAKILQEAIKVTQDGIIGPKTLLAANSNKKASDLFRQHRIKFYENLVKEKPSNQKFISGWLNRANKCKV